MTAWLYQFWNNGWMNNFSKSGGGILSVFSSKPLHNMIKDFGEKSAAVSMNLEGRPIRIFHQLQENNSFGSFVYYAKVMMVP